ncbi:hypothetical protein ACHAXT_009885 [Thalassiosira profunda]
MRRMSSLGSVDSYKLLCRMIDSKEGHDSSGTPSPASRARKKRNRSNVQLWNENDTKMFYLRISSDLYEPDASYRHPPRLPPCFTEEERRIIGGEDIDATATTDATFAIDRTEYTADDFQRDYPKTRKNNKQKTQKGVGTSRSKLWLFWVTKNLSLARMQLARWLKLI